MKSILKKFLIILITFSVICSICTISKAVNETINVDTNLIQPRTTSDEENDPYGINPISEGDLDESMLINEEEASLSDDTETASSTSDNYFSFTSEDVTIDNPIFGDAFIFTSGNVTINNLIYGNLFVFANNVEISHNAEISSSLFCFSNNLTIDGYVNVNAYVVATENFTLNESSNIYLDLFVTSNNININGIVNRNVYASCDELSISDTAHIAGTLDYTANSEATIPDGIVDGKINFAMQSVSDEKEPTKALDVVLSIISYIIFALIMFAIYKFLKPKFITSPSILKDHLALCILFGVLGILITPVVCILLLLIGEISSLSIVLSGAFLSLLFILLAVYILLLFIAPSTTIISLSNLLADKFKEKLKINSTLSIVLFICILSIIYKLISLVPVLGSIVFIALMVIGLGIWVKNILPEK